MKGKVLRQGQKNCFDFERVKGSSQIGFYSVLAPVGHLPLLHFVYVFQDLCPALWEASCPPAVKPVLVANRWYSLLPA